jgi:hypothetical protein
VPAAPFTPVASVLCNGLLLSCVAAGKCTCPWFLCACCLVHVLCRDDAGLVLNSANQNIRKVSAALLIAKREPPHFFPPVVPLDPREHYAKHANLLGSMDLKTLNAAAGLNWEQAPPNTQAQYLAFYYYVRSSHNVIIISREARPWSCVHKFVTVHLVPCICVQISFASQSSIICNQMPHCSSNQNLMCRMLPCRERRRHWRKVRGASTSGPVIPPRSR